MQKLQRFLPTFGAMLLGLCLAGCSSTDNKPDDGTAGSGGSGGSGGGTGGSGGTSSGDSGACKPFDYTGYMAANSPTLKKDIQPLFERGCALASSCHQTGSIHPPQLGPGLFTKPDSGIDATILQGIMTELAKNSQQITSKKFLVAGKPEDSYLMNKIDGTSGCAGTCTGPDGCGKNMPQDSPPLKDAEITMVRDWIKSGAAM